MQQSPSKLSVDQLASIARDVCVYTGRGNLVSAPQLNGSPVLKRLLGWLRTAQRAPAAGR